MPQIISENIDRLCTIEIRVRSGHTQRGIIRRLYEAAREKSGGLPLSYQAAKLLKDSVRPDDHVFFITGAGSPPRFPKGEVDGMLGTAILSHVVNVGLAAKPVLVVEDRYAGPLIAATQAVGIPVLDRSSVEQRRFGAIHESYPENEKEVQARVSRLFDDYQPSAVVAIERLSPNKKGYSHNVNGMGHPVKPLGGFLINEAKSRGIATVGIGDGGNEIGMGLIHDAVEEILPYGKKCQCPCGAGIAASVATDVLVVANVSNWGGYGVAASLATLCNDVELFPHVGTFSEMFRECVRAGALDGISTQQLLSDDGIPIEAHNGLFSILRSMITIGIKDLPQQIK